jgi:hypothetical protein
MPKAEDVLNKAYGSIPKEVGFYHDYFDIPVRGLKYYWLRLIRRIR